MQKLKIAFVGAGRRMRTLYLPVLRKLSDEFEVVGISTRNRRTGEAAGAELSLPWFPDINALAAAVKPDLLVICVPGASNVATADKALSAGIPFLMETPISHSLAEAKSFVKRWQGSGVHAGVTEQKPFLPLEQLKHQLIRAGAFGKILVAQNDFRSLDYHAIAQLRMCLAPDTIPETVQSQRLRHAVHPSGGNAGNVAASPKPTMEEWDLSTVRFRDGSTLIHHFTSLYKTLPYRTFQSLRIYGDRGSMVNEDIAWVDPQGVTLRTSVAAERSADGSGCIRGLSVVLPDGTPLAWKTPHPGIDFSDDQIGLALHFERMREAIQGKGTPLYDPSQALLDIEILAAIRVSGICKGKPVGFPFRPTLHKAGWLLWPGNWPQALDKVSEKLRAKR